MRASIQPPKQLAQYSPLMALASGVAALADGYAQGDRVERDLSNEQGFGACRGLDRASQHLAIADQLIQRKCNALDRNDRPIADGSAEGRR